MGTTNNGNKVQSNNVSMETGFIAIRRNLSNLAMATDLNNDDFNTEVKNALSIAEIIRKHTSGKDFTAQIETIKKSGLPQSTIDIAVADLEKQMSRGQSVDIEKVNAELAKFGVYYQYDQTSNGTKLPNRIMILEQFYSIKRGRASSVDRIEVSFEVTSDKALPIKVYSGTDKVLLVNRVSFDKETWQYAESDNGIDYKVIELPDDTSVTDYLKEIESVKLLGYTTETVWENEVNGNN